MNKPHPIKLAITLILLISGTCSRSAFSQMNQSKAMPNTPLLDRELFFGNPQISSGKLSPDGKFISFMKPYQGIMNVCVK